ncbi:PAP2 superfamily protein [Amycolatopsis sacchari]|uniref:PAP2 superfamily protein n=1 Tax=Amycolatopsis sacchari TaxID=115433 RepID=A0A1I3WAM7_9PSEU|nr:PAP2 superfamily protein [Amycolatopsis sacchari]
MHGVSILAAVKARIGAAATALAVVVVLGVWSPEPLMRGRGDGSALPELLSLFLRPTEPYVLIPLVALAVAVSALRRDRAAVLLCLAGPTVPLALNTWLLKPLFDHHIGSYLAYPSGHTVGLVSVLTVLVLLARPGTARAVTVSAAAVVTVAAGFGLVGSGYHYPLDVVGGTCFAVACVLTLSLATHPARAPSAGSPRAGTSSGSPPAASPR